MSAVVTIDLGEDWAAPDDPPARPRRRPPGAALAALLVVAVLLLIGGSAAPRPPFVLLADVSVPGITATEVGGDAVFVSTQSGGRRTIARYALDGGAPIWQVSQAGPASGLVYLAGADVLMVSSFDYPQGHEQFVVLDAATGGQLWQSAGGIVFGGPPASRYELMRMDDPDGSPRMRYLDMRNGRTIWSRTVPDLTQVVTADDQTRPEAAGFLLGYPDGTVLLLARDTGEVLGTGQLDPLVPVGPGGAPEPERSALINVVHGRLIVVEGTAGPVTTVSAYELPGITLQWSLSGQLPVYPQECGPNVCLSGNSPVVAVDPATGSVVWRSSGPVGVADLGGGRLLGYQGENGQAVSVLDAGTGRPVGDLGNWTPLAVPEGNLVSKPEVDDYRYTWFGVLVPARAVVLPLGRLGGLSTGGCQSHEDLLLCRTLDSRLKIWRYRE